MNRPAIVHWAVKVRVVMGCRGPVVKTFSPILDHRAVRAQRCGRYNERTTRVHNLVHQTGNKRCGIPERRFGRPASS